jgi:hypothetical protein
METQIQNILNQNGTKTAKIQQLLRLGLTRTQVAALVTGGNYGFVQNVYAKMVQNMAFNVSQPNTLAAFLPTTFTRRFGVEFEACNVTKDKLKRALEQEGINVVIEGYNHSTRAHWKIVTDSSLSGNNTFELVSPILQGMTGLEELKKVCNALNAANAKVNKTCGLHIHFDATGFALNEWKRIYINYARIEQTIDGFMPQSRRANNNTYCRGFTNIANFEQKINAARNLNAIESIFHSRYFKINPQSYARHNTIEFRQHSGTTEYQKVSEWIIFLHNLVAFSKNSLIEDRSLDGLSKFNNEQTTNYLKERTNKLN